MKHPVKTLGVLCHPNRQSVPPLLKTIVKWARTNGLAILLDQDSAAFVRHSELGVPRREMGRNVDLIMVLGGDGSILECVRTFAGDGIPIAGINLGHLGFLTLGEAPKTASILERLQAGLFRIENRMMLQAVVRRRGKQIFRGIALNDAVITKGPILRVIDLRISISGTHILTCHGDGVIFSTPTGSTAYSLSAGGPIVPPWVNALVVTPLNSHTLSTRPVITSDQESILADLSCTHSEVNLVLDGQEGFQLLDKDEIEISRAPEIGKIVVFNPRNFFQVLRKKMKWGK